MHDLLVSMQFCMLVAVAVRDIDNSWAAGTHNLLAILTPAYIVWFYLPLSCQYTPISCLFVLDNKLFGAETFYSMLGSCFDLLNISKHQNNANVVDFHFLVMPWISLTNILCLIFLVMNLWIIQYDYKKCQCSVLIKKWTAGNGFQSLKSSIRVSLLNKQTSQKQTCMKW